MVSVLETGLHGIGVTPGPGARPSLLDLLSEFLTDSWVLYLRWRSSQCTRMLKVSVLDLETGHTGIAVSPGVTNSDSHHL